jgi:hypothetical protein
LRVSRRFTVLRPDTRNWGPDWGRKMVERRGQGPLHPLRHRAKLIHQELNKLLSLSTDIIKPVHTLSPATVTQAKSNSAISQD